MAELEASCMSHECIAPVADPGADTGTIESRHAQPDLADMERLAAALAVQRGGADRLLPLDHWAFGAPPCITGTAIRTRFVRHVPTDEAADVTVRSGYRFATFVHEVRVGQQVAVTTSVLDSPLDPAPEIDHGAARLVGPQVDLDEVRDVVSARPLDVSNRIALVLLLAAVHGTGRPPLLGVHARFHTPFMVLNRVHVDLRLEPDGRSDFAIGQPGSTASMSGQLWFGCGSTR